MKVTANYQEGNLETDADYYRIHFRTTLRQPEHLEQIVTRLRVNFSKESVVKAREIENRLVDETWLLSEYDLLPKLKTISIPTLVIHGEHDIVPVACAAHIAQAIPAARFALLPDTGHFSYLENPDAVRQEILAFVHGS